MIKVYWASEEERIVRLDYYDPIESWEEYTDAVKESYALARTKSHKVHFIHNPAKTSMPGGNAFAYIRRMMEIAPANTGNMVMIIGNPFARRIMELMLKISVGAKNYYFVQNLEEAIKLTQDKSSASSV
jgi:hypothetical protein